MSVILPFNLPHIATAIQQIICLYDANPVFQFVQNADFSYAPTKPQDLIRDTTVASAGFDASVDYPYGGAVPGPGPTNNPLPANTYALALPSQTYGTSVTGDIYSVLQINTALARIEPGFDRIRVDYLWFDSGSNQTVAATSYFDCPIYEGWNTTARELKNIVDYTEGSTAFLQKEVDILNQEVAYAISRELWRGTSVSGRITTSQITTGLQTGALTRGVFAHSLPEFVDDSKALPYGQDTTGVMLNSADVATIVQNYNYTGYTAQNNYIYVFVDSTSISNPLWKGCAILAENTDGTLTFWFFDSNWCDGNAKGANFSINISGFVSKEALSVNPPGACFSIAAVNILAIQGPKPTDGFGNENDASGTEYHNATTALWVQNSYVGSSSNYYPLIAADTTDSGYNDHVDIPRFNGGPTATLRWFRARILPSGGKGSQLSFSNINHFTQFTHSQGNFPDGNGNSPTLTLNGPYIAKPFISNVTNNPACVGDAITITGKNFTSDCNVYIANTNYPVSNVVVQSGTIITCTIPPTAPTGSQNILVNNPIAGAASSYQITITAAPSITSITGTLTPNAIITINGVGFGPYYTGAPSAGVYDSTVTLSTNTTTCPISSWTDTQIICTVPGNTALGPCQIIVTNTCGQNANNNVTVGVIGTLSISPQSLVLATNATQQFVVTFTNANTQMATNVTAQTTFAVLEGASRTPAGGGDATYGTVTVAGGGLYTAPSVAPTSHGQSLNNPVIYVRATYNNYVATVPIIINLSGSLSIVPTSVALPLGMTQQFHSYFTTGSTATEVTSGGIWSVNSVTGGNATYGTIAYGIYNPPVYLPPSEPVIIGNTYVYSAITYTAQASATLQTPPASGMLMQVASQLNLYLGDGRFGYVPTGANVVGYLNQYLYAQFQERLMPGLRLPDAAYLPVQQLSLQLKNALDPDIANAIYNVADGTPQSDGSVLTKRTVVLGIIDPSDGLFHSMWDINNPLPAPDDESHSLPELYADKMKAFSMPHTFQGSIMEYIDDISGGAQKQLNALAARSNVILAGTCAYDNLTHNFTIINPLRILGVSIQKSYGILGVIPEQTITVKPNQYLYIDGSYQLKVGNFSDAFNGAHDAKTIVIGTVLDTFYSNWPLLQGLEVDTSGVKNLGKNSWMQIGPLLVQWGPIKGVESINFPKPFMQSCIVLSEPSGAIKNNNLQSFETNDSEGSWLAMGM